MLPLGNSTLALFPKLPPPGRGHSDNCWYPRDKTHACQWNSFLEGGLGAWGGEGREDLRNPTIRGSGVIPFRISCYQGTLAMCRVNPGKEDMRNKDRKDAFQRTKWALLWNGQGERVPKHRSELLGRTPVGWPLSHSGLDPALYSFSVR